MLFAHFRIEKDIKYLENEYASKQKMVISKIIDNYNNEIKYKIAVG